MIERELINNLYWEKQLSVQKIADELGLSHKAIDCKMKRFGIPKRSRLESLKLQRRNRFNYNAEGKKYLEILGLSLYWAEGGKTQPRRIEFTNSDPEMSKVFMAFLRSICGVSEKHLRCKIQIHNSDLYQKSLDFWSSTIGIPKSQFLRRYLKADKQGKNKHPLGILSIIYNDAGLREKIFERISQLPLTISLM